MGLFLTVGCFVSAVGLIAGIFTVVLQYFQIKKLRQKICELKEEVGKEERKEGQEEKAEKLKTSKKRVTFKDFSESTCHTAGDDSLLETDTISSNFKAFIHFLEEYKSQLVTSLNVSSPFPSGAVFSQFPADAPKKGKNFSDALADFKNTVLSKAIHWLHPHYLGPPGPGKTTVDVLAQFIRPLVTVAEKEEYLTWLKKIFEVPQFETEFAVESATEAHFHMALAARNRKIQGIEGSSPEKMVIYSSNEANMSVGKASRLAMMRHHKVAGEQPVAELERRIEKDIAAGLLPAVIILTLGSYGVMTLESDRERVDELAPLAEKYGCWLHVDASSIGGYWLGERGKKWKPSFKKVDSLFLEMFLHSESIKIIWTKHEEHWTQPLSNLTEKVAFRLFVTFSLLGAKKLGKILDSHYQLSFELEDRLKRCRNIQIYSPPHSANFFSFSFQYYSPDLGPCQTTAYTKRLYAFLQSSRKFVFGCRDLRGTTVIVASVLGYLHEVRDVEEIWTELGPLIEEFEKRKDETVPILLSSDSCTLTPPSVELSMLSFDPTC